MAFDTSALKTISNSLINNITKSVSKENGENPDLWKPTPDHNGNALAVIRLLPAIVDGKLPWVKTECYWIRGENGWYHENSLRMIGKNDPMHEYISSLWKEAGSDEEKRERLRALKLRPTIKYRCAALVIDDQSNPANNGRVVLYEFNKTIYDKIIQKAEPSFANERRINVFDWTEGCNLKINIYKNGEYPRYDRCTFAEPSAIPDSQIPLIAEKIFALDLYSLENPSNFKTYDQLKARVNEVFGLSNANVDNINFASSKPVVASKSPSTSFVNDNVSTNEFGTNETKKPATSNVNDIWGTSSEGDVSADDIEFESLLKF